MPRRSIKALFFTLSLLSILLLSIGSFWLFEYIKFTTDARLEHLSHEKSYDIRYKIMQFYDQMYYEFEMSKPDNIEKMVLAQHYFDKYGTDAPLEPLKQILQSKDFEYEIYLINHDLIIEKTTFSADLGLNFNKLTGVPSLFNTQFSDPNKIDLSRPYYEPATADFKRYMTQRSSDGRYIIQLGQSLRGEKSFSYLMRNLKKNIPTLYSSAVFSVFSTGNTPWTVQEIWSKRHIGMSKANINRSEEVSSDFKKILLQIDPTTSSLFLFPKLYLYPYLKIIFQNNTMKEVLSYKNNRYIHMIMIPYQSYYQQNEKSYSLLVLEFDETKDYQDVQSIRQMMFLATGIIILLFFFMSLLFYRRIIAPISILQSHMYYKTPLDDTVILTKGDEISKIAQTYNWLLKDLQNEIAAKQTLLTQFKTFTANAIHQIRTPLSVIKIALEMIEDSKDNDAKLHIRSSTITMEHLYNSLAFTLQNEEVSLPVHNNLDISSILQERVELFQPVAQSLDSTIDLTIRNGITVDMNKLELEFLIDNNLSNALKYGHPGKPVIVLLSHTDDELILVFESYGKPITDTNSIFQRYTRQDETKQGSGIGLNIVSTICKHYNIIIQITYEEGKNCFRYYIPIKH